MFVCLKMTGTFVLGSLMIVSGIMLSDKALTPIPHPQEVPRADSRLLVENRWLRDENAKLERERLAIQVELDVARRGAIWFPPKPSELGAGDLIPAQHLDIPTRKEQP